MIRPAFVINLIEFYIPKLPIGTDEDTPIPPACRTVQLIAVVIHSSDACRIFRFGDFIKRWANEKAADVHARRPFPGAVERVHVRGGEQILIW